MGDRRQGHDLIGLDAWRDTARPAWAIGKEPQRRSRIVEGFQYGVVMSSGPMRWFETAAAAIRWIDANPMPGIREQFRRSMEATNG